MSGFQISGLAEFQKDIQAVIEHYPDETSSWMRKEANQWKKDCNARMPGYYKNGKRPIPKSWKIEGEYTHHTATEYRIQNRSPHFHLVENGHAKYIHGQNTGGFVAGKHYAEKTREEWKEKFPEDVNGFIDEMLGKRRL